MVVILFRSKLSEAAVEGYPDMASEMLERAKQMPGFIDFKSYKSDDGERLSVIHWQDLTVTNPQSNKLNRGIS